MKTKRAIVEIICLILVLNFFYEGIYKIAYIKNYGLWLHHAPLLKSGADLLVFAVPTAEILLAILFLISKTRVLALYSVLVGLVLFILWIMSVYLFTNRLFWPYHALWDKPTWWQKTIISLGLCWFTFIAIILLNPKISFKRHPSNSLRNKPANAS